MTYKRICDPYELMNFPLQALRHSKVKLTWDEDDPERNQITRRTLSKQEIDEGDFKAYLASSGSESDTDTPDHTNTKYKDKKMASRDKLRALLLAGDDDELPEGWGRGDEDEPRDIDMEITFTPGLSENKDKNKEETTLEKYERKMKEKRKKRKDELKEDAEKEKGETKDDFFDASSEDEAEDAEAEVELTKGKKKKGKDREERKISSEPVHRHESTAEELALLAASDNPNEEPKHFNLKSVLKAEKRSKGKGKKGKKKGEMEDNEIQEEFAINVKDDRFKALHDDHTFAIDPSNPRYVFNTSLAGSCILNNHLWQIQENQKYVCALERALQTPKVITRRRRRQAKAAEAT